jgi:hypothetical protein
MLDAGCGDCHWVKDTDLGEIEYIGVDVVPLLIYRNQEALQGPRRRFQVADVTRDPLPAADVVLCRDCLIHLSNRHVLAALRNFHASGARYLLANTYPLIERNRDIPTGSFRPVNLQRSTFDLPAPLRYLDDGREDVESPGTASAEAVVRLGLWKLGGARFV